MAAFPPLPLQHKPQFSPDSPKWGGDLPEGLPPQIGLAKLHSPSSAGEIAQRTQFLTDIFNAFDRDGSGEIDAVELRKLLIYCGVSADETVVEHILGDIDVDAGGAIDLDEFLEFFQRVSDMEMLRAELEAETKKYSKWAQLMRVYFVINTIGVFFFAIAYLGSDNSNSEGDTVTLGGLLISSLSFIMIICGGLVMPIVKIKMANNPKFNGLKDKIASRAKMLQRSKEQEAADFAMNHANKEGRREVPPPPDVVDVELPPPNVSSYRQKLSLRQAGMGMEPNPYLYPSIPDMEGHLSQANAMPALERSGSKFSSGSIAEVEDDPGSEYDESYTAFYGYNLSRYGAAQAYYEDSGPAKANFNPWSLDQSKGYSLPKDSRSNPMSPPNRGSPAQTLALTNSMSMTAPRPPKGPPTRMAW
eukprot:gnl/MRDRNA2_/MRDRNA2_33673_c0_seq1.p1 gnl/MRDRNA2_/MRDRNA2_33673_c0~~gnl/MRDRNA2_/MRDRNA2_33673_c0_seq1.p1  ORF type:complete len:442 (-),score=76.37 gnl/MRDRNA2_/MRDRNA2_33673_c0_seq1:7-1257(-)